MWKTKPIWFVSLVFTVIACDNGAEVMGTREIAQSLGRAEFPLVTQDTPAGFVDFYLGNDVIREFAKTGSFEPTPEKQYSLIRIPDAIVARAQESTDPVTVSICNPDNRIVLVGHRAGPQYHPRTDVVNCTPWVDKREGEVTFTLTSGMPGLVGVVQVSRDKDGNLAAGAIVAGRLESACPGDGQSDASMVLGTFVPDETAEDPEIEHCRLNGE